ncbi:hypothetical protein [Phenylobacterium sp.]|uniref:hypothetical protein n=1 Tax=Phenylobacterium sp. TaxID=1871053 RepID=UPI0035AF9839
MLRLFSAAVLVCALAAGDPAIAEEVIATGQAAAEAPKPAASDAAAQIDAWIKTAPPVKLDDEGPDGVTPGREPRKMHGEVGVTVGSGGYRSAYAVSVIPVGETGTVSLAVSKSQGGRFYGGPGGRPFNGGDRSSVALAVNLGPQAERACPAAPVGPIAFEDHAGPDLYVAECRARARVQNPD